MNRAAWLAVLVAAGCSAAPADPVTPPPVLSTTVPAAHPQPSGPLTPAPRTTARATHPPPAPTPARPRFADGADDPGRAPVITADPRAVGQALASAEAAIRSDSASVAAARTQQVAYRIWAPHPDWDGTVLSALPDQLRQAARANLTARRALLALSSRTPAPDALPHWSIVPPAPQGDLLRYYRDAGAEFGVDWEYLAAINIVETTVGRIHGLSSSGARGPMQFMASTWAIVGEGDIDDPHDAIRAAARWLSMRGFPTDLEHALHSYNPSPYYGTAVKQIASVLRADPAAFAGYYGWDVYVRTALGYVLLPVGFVGDGHTKASTYLAQHPDRLLSSAR